MLGFPSRALEVTNISFPDYSTHRNENKTASSLDLNTIVSMTSFAFWVHTEVSSANENNSCSEVSNHENFDSIVMVFCVSETVLRNKTCLIPTSSSPCPVACCRHIEGEVFMTSAAVSSLISGAGLRPVCTAPRRGSRILNGLISSQRR